MQTRATLPTDLAFVRISKDRQMNMKQGFLALALVLSVIPACGQAKECGDLENICNKCSSDFQGACDAVVDKDDGDACKAYKPVAEALCE